jgi:hypothetical protein
LSDATDKQDLTPEKLRLLAETRADLLKRQLSNSENYDKAVLSLSTAFLGLSLAFLKDLVPVQRAECLFLLYFSWIVLAGAVLSTILSFWLSQRAINVQIKKAEDYYLRNDRTALSRSRIAKATDWVNALSGVLFVVGVSLTTAFVIVNFEGGLKMNSDKKSEHVPLTEGATIPKMQEVPQKVNRGAPIPNIQPGPQSEPPSQSIPTTPPPDTKPSGGDKK